MIALTAERLQEILSYDPDTGKFACKVSRGALRAGAPAGTQRQGRPYVILSIDGEKHYAHRLAWLYIYGEWPAMHLDHINGNPADNRIFNLRLATSAQNNANSSKRRRNRSGYKGVTRYHSKWAAHIYKNGRSIYLGAFPTREEAHAAYVQKARELFGEFARAS